jgi:hypothetical protein
MVQLLTGQVASLFTLAATFFFLLYGVLETRSMNHQPGIGAAVVGFAFGAMNLAHRAGVNDVPGLLVTALMAANFVLLLAAVTSYRGSSDH